MLLACNVGQVPPIYSQPLCRVRRTVQGFSNFDSTHLMNSPSSLILNVKDFRYVVYLHLFLAGMHAYVPNLET